MAYIATAEAYRGSGYGRSLLHTLMQQWVHEGFTEVISSVDQKAIGFFQALGFEESVRMPKFVYAQWIDTYASAKTMGCDIGVKLARLLSPRAVMGSKRIAADPGCPVSVLAGQENAPGEDEVWCRARITNNQTATGLVTITYRHGTAHRVETLPTSCPRMKIGDSSNTSSGLPHFPASTKVHQYSFGMGVQWPVPKCSDCGVVCGNCVALHCICTGEGGASSRKRPGEGLSETPIPLKAMKTEEGGPGESNGGITRHCQCADPTPYPQTAKTRKTVKTPATPSDPAGGPMVPAVASVLSPTSPAPFQNPPPAEVPSVPNVVALAAAAAVAKVAAAQNLSETTSKKAAASSAAPGGNEVAAKSAGARRTTRRSAARPSEAVSGQTESGAVEKEVVEVKQEPM
ncbi:hypothetical protein FOZ62_005931, partial [Perkinsus olseni]